MIRQLSPYEKTHLQRFNKNNIDIANYDEMPVEYITGKVEFYKNIFKVNQDVLIPRIEEFVNLDLKEIKKTGRDEFVIVDIGCGSGVIGISLWLELHKLRINVKMYLSDISDQALVVTQKNADSVINQSKQIHILNSDLLKNYPKEIKFDLIVANLPYIPTERIQVLDESVRKYEPHLALDGGGDGLKYIRELVKQAEDKLNPGGIILLELDYTYDEKFLKKNLKLDKLKIEVKRDQFGKIRFGVIKRD